MRTRRFFSQLLACALAAVLLLGLIPATALALAENASLFYSTTTATVLPAYGNTQQIKIESYLTNKDTTDVTIKPCDIIFVMDQSKWMNTENDAGLQRTAIITAMKELLNTLSTPTTGGEHRVAIAGYGRVNVNGRLDPYDAATYPGQVSSSNAISFNTGYYTTSGFVSKNGWTEVADFTSEALPQMPSGYLVDESYDDTFMTLSEAQSVLDPDTMMAWYAGASRMDAGLTIAEQLANIATEHDENNERNLIVCILASSLPIQNTPNTNKSVIRYNAVIAASEKLKAQGATIFAFGDYHASDRTISGEMQDTQENFTAVMQSVCSSPDKFYSLTDYTNITDAMNRLITQITITSAGEASCDYTISADQFVLSGVETTWGKTDDKSGAQIITWQSIVDYYGEDAQKLIDSVMTRVEYYNFLSYDSNGEPIFDDNSYVSFDIPLADMVDENGIAFDTTMIPIPANTNDCYGYKAVITIASPITVTYEWASRAPSYAPSRYPIPEPETMAIGTTHTTPTIQTTDEHYLFNGWYTDQACISAYTGEVVPITNFTLYGKWTQYALIEYYWNIWDGGYAYPDTDAHVELGEIPDVYTPDGMPGYMFGGWYWDADCTTPYEPQALDMDIELYAKWIPNADTEYTVRFYQQNLDDDGYTEVTADALTLTGKTDEAIAPITKAYRGFTLDHITYEDTTHTAQSEALAITGDGSVTVRVYFDRNLYTVTYDGNGADGGTVPTDDTAYRYGATVTAAEDTVTREQYAFTAWNTAADNSGTSYAPNGTFEITGDTTLFAQWTPEATPAEPITAAYKVEHYKQQLDGSYMLIETNFPLYGTLGFTVTASTKTYEHYHVNREKSLLSGTVVSPTVENGKATLLTLKVYYDLDTVTVSYDLNSGSADAGVDYSDKTVFYGTAVTVNAAPTREGYTFVAWSAAAVTYAPNDALSAKADITLVAQWQENPQPTTTTTTTTTTTAAPTTTTAAPTTTTAAPTTTTTAAPTTTTTAAPTTTTTAAPTTTTTAAPTTTTTAAPTTTTTAAPTTTTTAAPTTTTTAAPTTTTTAAPTTTTTAVPPTTTTAAPTTTTTATATTTTTTAPLTVSTATQQTVPSTTVPSTTQPNADSPKTGEHSETLLWIVLLLISSAGLMGTTMYTFRKNCRE